MAMTAYVMEVMKGGRPERNREAVLMKADNDSTVAWAKKYREGGGRMPE